jgi:hypothetical protein
MATAEKFPEAMATETWERDGLRYSIVKHRSGHLCGYVRFPSRPVREEGYDGVLTYAPVHGGLTYARSDEGGMVYGFDCAHAGDNEDPKTSDVEWVRAECERMGAAVRAAAEIEEAYLLASGNEEKAKVLDPYRQRMRDAGCDEGFNMGAAIAMMGGSL